MLTYSIRRGDSKILFHSTCHYLIIYNLISMKIVYLTRNYVHNKVLSIESFSYLERSISSILVACIKERTCLFYVTFLKPYRKFLYKDQSYVREPWENDLCKKKQFKALPVSTYLFKVDNRNTGKRSEISLDLTIKTPERRHWCRSGVFIVNFEHISHLFLLLQLLI